MNETEILRHIRVAYGAIIVEAASKYGHRPEVMAGILMRETQGGLSPLLDCPGPQGRGDRDKEGRYHGHGLWQIDDRSFPVFCAGDDWKDPLKNAEMAAADLRAIRALVDLECAKYQVAGDRERMVIAGYDCGADLAVHNQRRHGDPDTGTTGADYSAAVLRYAAIYKSLEAA